ncbi:unnamed protein product, partial [Mesorhabditis belari]|uniref:Uncharacterized protein n=1 Tax=Mesorhabditis belari TaxID=2138241 RepID=A0AAF3EV47_9BILA
MRTEWNRFYVFTCKSHIYELTEAEPTMAFFGSYLHKLYLRDEEPICLSVKDCFSCDVLINVISYCTNEKNSSCEIAPFMINGTNITLSRCEKTFDSLMNLTSYECYYELSGQIIINLIDGVDYTRSSISFRAFKWMEDSVDFKLITMSRDDKVGNIRMKFDRFDYPIWLLLSVGEADWIKYLRKVRWDHHDKDCEYLLIEGSPPGKVKDLSRELAIFRDQDLFFPQFLLSRMYSLLIPPNCSPTIVMSSEPIEFGKRIPEQELCAGTALIITPYYHKETKDEIVLDFIMYNFYCYRFLINVIIEVIEVESGVVTVEFRDYFNKTRSNET